MSQNGSNPHDVPGNFGSQPEGTWQGGPAPQGPAQEPAQSGQQDPGRQYPTQQDPGRQYPGRQYPTQPYPTQQYPTQQYPGPGQYGQQPTGWGQQQPGQWNSQQQPGGPQQPWGYPPAPNQNQPRKPNRVLFGVIGGVVGVALIGGTVFAVQRANSSNPDPQPSVRGSVPPPTVPTAKPSDVVVAYLRALGAGDATTVLSLAATQPTETTFLTNAMLAKTTAGKIADVQVPEVSDAGATSVSASYTLAGKAVSTSFPVTKVGSEFRLTQVAAEVDLSTVAKVPLTLAGTRPGSERVQLFPGTYPVAPANKYYSLGSVKVIVTDLNNVTPAARTLVLSSAGRSAIIKATSTKYKWCLKQNTALPKGCAIGVKVPTGVKIRNSTIAWTTRGGAKWSKMKPKLLSPVLAEAAARAKVHFYARDARISGRYWFKDVYIQGVRALISGTKVTVSFY